MALFCGCYKAAQAFLRKRAALHKLRIPRHPATQSTFIRPGIPRTSGHLFHDHSDRQSERSDAGLALLVRGARRRQFLRPFAQRFALEIDPIGVVHQAVEDGVGQGRIADQFVPVVHLLLRIRPNVWLRGRGTRSRVSEANGLNRLLCAYYTVPASSDAGYAVMLSEMPHSEQASSSAGENSMQATNCSESPAVKPTAKMAERFRF